MSTLFRRECYNILFPLRHEATTSSNEGDTPMDSVSTPSDHPPEFRQVVLHAQNQIILTKVLTQDKEKVGGNWMVTRAWSGRSESYCNTTSVCDMHVWPEVLVENWIWWVSGHVKTLPQALPIFCDVKLYMSLTQSTSMLVVLLWQPSSQLPVCTLLSFHHC